MLAKDKNSILANILHQKRLRIEYTKKQTSVSHLITDIKTQADPIPFTSKIQTGAVIAEMKRTSPSGGILDTKLDVVERSHTYIKAGANALSILTEEDNFNGSLCDLVSASRVSIKYNVPVLQKDFIFDEHQVYQARAHGASSILLISSILYPKLHLELTQLSRELGMEPLHEVHNNDELEDVMRVQPKIIGINNRDLSTLEVSLNTFETLAKRVPSGILKVAESGMKNTADVARMFNAGADAVLVGESLMRAGKNSAQLIAQMRAKIVSIIGGSVE